MSLRVLDPGLYTLVVDFGRPHCRSLGVPVGGAADRTSLMLGNALVGNPPNAAALEFALNGPVVEAQCELACVVYGAPFELRSKRQKLKTGKTFTLQPGEVLEVGGTHEGMRAYLCVAGGIRAKEILDSRSGLEPVQAGTVLQCDAGRIARRFARPKWEWDAQRKLAKELGLVPDGELLHILDGPQFDWFPAQILTGADGTLGRQTFQISPSSNRMGLRLQGPPLPFPDHEMLSEPVCPGTVQVTRDGQCIILGVDGQTIGGYPKIAQIISADLDLLGQLRPGEKIVFQRVSLDEAERLYRAKRAEVKEWIVRMRISVGYAPPSMSNPSPSFANHPKSLS